MKKEQTTEYSTLSFNLPFDEAIKDLRSIHNRKMIKNSHNYFVLYALFRGEVLDDYVNRPVTDEGVVIHNLKSRISDLANKFTLNIEKDFAEGKAYMKYWMAR